MEQFNQFFNIFTAAEWLMISVVVVLVMSLASFKRQRKLQQINSLSMKSLQRDLRALANAAVGVGGRVLEIERLQRHNPNELITQESLEQNQNPAPTIELYNSVNQSYEQAIRMVQSGASVNDIVTVCGLSQSEAELVSMMHRLDKAC